MQSPQTSSTHTVWHTLLNAGMGALVDALKSDQGVSWPQVAVSAVVMAGTVASAWVTHRVQQQPSSLPLTQRLARALRFSRPPSAPTTQDVDVDDVLEEQQKQQQEQQTQQRQQQDKKQTSPTVGGGGEDGVHDRNHDVGSTASLAPVAPRYRLRSLSKTSAEKENDNDADDDDDDDDEFVRCDVPCT